MLPLRTTQIRGQHRQAVHPVACISSLRRKRDQFTAVTNAQAVSVLGRLQKWGLLGNVVGVKQAQVPDMIQTKAAWQEEVVLNTSNLSLVTAISSLRGGPFRYLHGGCMLYKIDHCWRSVLPAPARAALRFGGRAGRVYYAIITLPHSTEASSSAPCALHGLTDVAGTPHCESTSCLHDDAMVFHSTDEWQ